MLHFKVTANMNTYDYWWNTKTIKNYSLIQKNHIYNAKTAESRQILDNCFRCRDFFQITTMYEYDN